MSEPNIRRTRRGVDAVHAAIEEFELRTRLDEPDAEAARAGDYDLAWAHDRIDAARRAAEADVVSADEALDWLAETVADELPDEPSDDDREA